MKALDRAAFEKSILQVIDFRRVAEHYGNDIKTNLVPINTGARHEALSSTQDMLSLLLVNCAIRAAELG